MKIAFCRDSTKKPRCIKCSCHSSLDRLDGKTFAYGTAWRHRRSECGSACRRAPRSASPFLFNYYSYFGEGHLTSFTRSLPSPCRRLKSTALKYLLLFYFFGCCARQVWLIAAHTQRSKALNLWQNMKLNTGSKAKDTSPCLLERRRKLYHFTQHFIQHSHNSFSYSVRAVFFLNCLSLF